MIAVGKLYRDRQHGDVVKVLAVDSSRVGVEYQDDKFKMGVPLKTFEKYYELIEEGENDAPDD